MRAGVCKPAGGIEGGTAGPQASFECVGKQGLRHGRVPPALDWKRRRRRRWVVVEEINMAVVMRQ
jgi:hypothetical protein